MLVWVPIVNIRLTNVYLLNQCVNIRGRCGSDFEHRQLKYQSNVIEYDHGKRKKLINATTLGSKSMKAVTLQFKTLNEAVIKLYNCLSLIC